MRSLTHYFLLLSLGVAILPSTAFARETSKRYAIIIGNNTSLPTISQLITSGKFHCGTGDCLIGGIVV